MACPLTHETVQWNGKNKHDLNKINARLWKVLVWHIVDVQQIAGTILCPQLLFLSGNPPAFLIANLVFNLHNPTAMSTPLWIPDLVTWRESETLLAGLPSHLLCKVCVHSCSCVLTIPSCSLHWQSFWGKLCWLTFLSTTQGARVRFLWKTWMSKKPWYQKAENKFRNYSQGAVENPPLVFPTSAILIVGTHHLWKTAKKQIMVRKENKNRQNTGLHFHDDYLMPAS